MSNNQALALVERELEPHLPSFAEALPAAMDPARREALAARIIRTMVISCERTPKLLQASANSRLQAAFSAAVLGLEVDGVTGQGYLIPFKGNCQFIPGYKGLISLAGRSGFGVEGRLVRECDEFKIRLGSDPWIDHAPNLSVDRSASRIVAAYATARSLSIPTLVHAMSLDEILKVRDASAGYKSQGARSVWSTEFPGMARKTPIRAISRDIPSIPMQRAEALETMHDVTGSRTYLRSDGALVVDDGRAEPFGDRQPEPGEPIDITPDKPELAVELPDGSKRIFTSPIQWQGFLMQCVGKLSTEANLEAFRSANGPILAAVKASHPDEVGAVDIAFEARREAFAEESGDE
jgi:recombination protein RecT